MKSIKLNYLILFLLASNLVIGQSMTLALEGEEWKGVKEYKVKGRNGFKFKEKLSFGNYASLDVDRSWTKGTEVTAGITQGIPTDEYYQRIITTNHIHKKQTLYFSLGDDAGNASRAYCVSRLDAKDFNVGHNSFSAVNLLLDLAGPGMESSNVFFTNIFVGPSAYGWELFLDNEAAVAHPKKYVGYLAKNDKEYYTIVPTAKVKSKKGKVSSMPFGSIGFIIRNKDGKALAAVSLIDNGMIYLMDTDPEEQLLLATTCAVLLMRPEDLE